MSRIELFRKAYDGESIVDVPRDVWEAFDMAFNPHMREIPDDGHGFPKGTFEISIIWSEDV